MFDVSLDSDFKKGMLNLDWFDEVADVKEVIDYNSKLLYARSSPDIKSRRIWKDT